MSRMSPPELFPGLPHWVPRFCSDDVDEVGWQIRDLNQAHGSLVPHGTAALGYWQQRLFGLGVHLGHSGTRQGITLRCHLTGCVLHLAVPPGSDYQFGRRRAVTSVCSAALLPPGQEFTRRSPAGSLLALRFDPARVQADLAARRAADGGLRCLPFVVTSLSSSEREAFLRTGVELMSAAGPQGDPRALRHVDSRLYALLAALIERGAEPTHLGAVSASRLSALETWIDAHLAEPLTLARLCEQAGVGARSLQKAFEARRGMSPMRHVAERRFAAVRRRLRRALPSETVTSIAIDCGFDHMGRFARDYKRLYGESPSRTLAGRRADSLCG